MGFRNFETVRLGSSRLRISLRLRFRVCEWQHGPERVGCRIFLSVSLNRGPQYGPQYVMVLIMGTPKMVPLIMGNPIWVIDPRLFRWPVGLFRFVASRAARGAMGIVEQDCISPSSRWHGLIHGARLGETTSCG